jgi:microcystin-dependent protein
MWAGTVQQINNLAPKWVLCDGTNGTPDLRSRFIVGAASDSNGGAALSNPVNQLSDSANNAQLTSYQPNNYGGEEEHALTLREIPTNGTTNRSFEWNWGFSPEDLNKGSFSFPHNNMPPFYALAFIMKIAN